MQQKLREDMSKMLSMDSQTKNKTLPMLVNNMAGEGMSAEAISRCLLPVSGLGATVAQVRKMIAMNKEQND